MSISRMHTPPRRNPTKAGNQTGRSFPSDISMAGESRDQKLAAIITPAANPSIASRTFLSSSLKKITRAAPAAVMNQVKSPAISACWTGLYPSMNPMMSISPFEPEGVDKVFLTAPRKHQQASRGLLVDPHSGAGENQRLRCGSDLLDRVVGWMAEIE
jgi:hypothetical protein